MARPFYCVLGSLFLSCLVWDTYTGLEKITLKGVPMCMCTQTHLHSYVCAHMYNAHIHTKYQYICTLLIHVNMGFINCFAVYISLLYMCVTVRAFLTRQSTLWKRQWPGSWFRLLHNWRQFLLIIFSDNPVHWEGEMVDWRMRVLTCALHSCLLSSCLLCAVGSVLRPTGGRGSEEGCFLQMTEDTTLQGFTIYYPDQVPDKVPVPYPWWAVHMCQSETCTCKMQNFRLHTYLRSVVTLRYGVQKTLRYPKLIILIVSYR